MMWKPSVKAIWLRAASRSAASGKRSAPTESSPRPGGPLDARELAFDQRALALTEAGSDPLDQHLEAAAQLAAQVEEVDTEVGEERRPAREPESPDLTYRLAASDDRERPLVEVLERRAAPSPPARMPFAT